MSDLPDELRDRAAQTVAQALFDGRGIVPAQVTVFAVVDAVAEVLSEHQGEADKAFTDLCHKFNDAQDELVLLRAIVAELRPDAVAEMESPEAEAHSHGFAAGRDSAEAEIADQRVRAERAEADLAQARGVVDAAKALVGQWHVDAATYPDIEIGNAARVAVRLCGRELAEVLARSVSPDHTGEKP